MPTYKYKCLDCETEFEVIQKISDEPLTTCKACGKNTVQRLLFASVFQLKGAGWYQTDYASGKSNTASSSTNLNKTKGAENSNSCDSENLTAPKTCADCQDKPAPTNA
jgi:putative FmdB family regulatory protein